MDNSNIFLERNDFDVASGKTFTDLHLNPEFSDVTLVSQDNHFIHAHKVIISSCSSVLRNILLGSNQQHIINIGTNYSDLKQLVKFMYTGQCDVEPLILVSFLAVAKSLQIKGLAPNDKEEDSSREFSNNVEDISTIHAKDDTGKQGLEVKIEELKIPSSLEYKEYKHEIQTKSTDFIGETKTNDMEIITVDQVKNDLLLDAPPENIVKEPSTITSISGETFDGSELSPKIEYKETNHKDVHSSEKTKGTSDIQEMDDCLPNIVHELNTETKSNIIYKYSCEKCDQSFMREKLLNNHAKLHETGKLTCKECNKDCFTYYGMINHNQTVHKRIDKKFNCEYCDYKAAYKVGVINHKRMMHADNLFGCDSCDFKSVDKGVVRKHTKSSHQGSCSICNCAFTNENKKSHMETHKVNGLFSCDICKYQTTLKWNQAFKIKMHKIWSHDNISLVCDEDNCEYKTNRKASLKTHKENIHLQIKYTCDECGHQASTNSNLHQHIDAKHNLHEITCELCGETLDTPLMLFRHKRTKHA